MLPGVLVLLFAAASAFAEPVHGRLPLQRFTASEGLVNESVMDIHTDPRGFVWFGTLDGLSRFDGGRFVNYTSDHGLPDRMIWAVADDRGGGIWIATSKGPARLTPSATRGPNLFSLIEPAAGVEPGGSVLFVDVDGTVWASCGTNNLCRVRNDRLELESSYAEAGGREVMAIRDGPGGELWVGTSHGLMRRTRSGTWRHYAVHPQANGDDGVGGLLFDGEGRLWIATGFGLIVFHPGSDDPNPGPLDALASKPLLPGDPFQPPLPGRAVMIAIERSPPIICRDPFRARDGAIWQPCYAGLFRIKETVEYFDQRDGLPFDLTDVGEDPDGELWIASRNDGALRLVGSSARTYDRSHGLANERIMSVFRLDDETVCATNRVGLSCIRSGEIHHASLWPKGSVNRGWGWNQIVARDSSGTLWFAGGEKLIRWPRVSVIEDLGRIEPMAAYGVRDGLDHDTAFRVWIDSRDRVWVGTFGHKPLSRGDARTGRFVSFGKEVGLTVAPTAFAEDRAGNIWIGLYTGGIMRNNGDKFESVGGDLPSGLVRDLKVDSAGGLWVGTTGGLARIANPTASVDQLTIRRYSREDGLSANSGYCIVELPDGRIGIGSQRGFDVLDPQGGTVVPITVREGLASNEVTVALSGGDGALWLGTSRGLSYFPSIPRQRASRAVQPRIHAVAIDGIPTPVPELGSSLVSGVRIAYPRHAVSLNFSAPQHDRSQPFRFEYRLGRDDEWIRAGSQGALVFDRLPSGAGSIEVRTVTPAGQASAPAVMAFEVIPPIWRRAWFLVLVAVALIALALLAHQARVAQLVAMERVRTRVATDLHDDLGSSLSRISILSEAAKRKNAVEAAPILDEIAESSRGLVDALGDTIWSIDPRRDDVGSVLLRARQFAAAVFEAQHTAIDLAVPDGVASLPLGAEQRRELYLILKEALNNAARHAGATRVQLEAGLEAGALRITVRDDGRGFGSNGTGRMDGGRGVPSMTDRARQAGGRMQIKSMPGQGAEISVLLPIPR